MNMQVQADFLNWYLKTFLKNKGLSASWLKEHGLEISRMHLPELFGESCMSGTVFQVCHDIFSGKPFNKKVDTTIELLYGPDAASVAYDFAEGHAGVAPVVGEVMTLEHLYVVLCKFKEFYLNNTIPHYETSFERSLFNTLRTYIFEKTDFFPKKFEFKSDERGELFEVLRHCTLEGQFYVSTTKPGVTRGNHYHTRKFERFAVISGEAEISLRKIFSDKIIKFHLSGRMPSYVDMPTFYAHNIQNIGRNDLLTLFWSDEILNKHDLDTYPEAV